MLDHLRQRIFGSTIKPARIPSDRLQAMLGYVHDSAQLHDALERRETAILVRQLNIVRAIKAQGGDYE